VRACVRARARVCVCVCVRARDLMCVHAQSDLDELTNSNVSMSIRLSVASDDCAKVVLNGQGTYDRMLMLCECVMTLARV
jgi:hypothetical protein